MLVIGNTFRQIVLVMESTMHKNSLGNGDFL